VRRLFNSPSTNASTARRNPMLKRPRAGIRAQRHRRSARQLKAYGRYSRIACVPTKARIRALWAAAKKARGIGPADQVHAAFMALAIETNLIDARGYWTGSDVRDYVRRHGREDVAHVITWALRGWNPVEKGPLK
jgi:hypothetical protein